MPTNKLKILIIFEDDLLAKVDDYRFENRINSRSEAIRRLIIKGLNSTSLPVMTTQQEDYSNLSIDGRPKRVVKRETIS
jgi:metal-responsive CopG/Arc/MetJ family transcriptional regulator